MDMDPGIQAFAEESHEMLEEIENILLKLEDEPDDSGLINELFRAVHTIKGASGLFGFDNVMNFTHTAESVMMRVRDGEIPVTPDLLNLLLSSRDQMLTLVDIALDGNGALDAEVQATDDKLSTQLHAFLGEEIPTKEDDHSTENPEEINESTENDVASGNWHLSLRFKEDVLRDGMDPLSFMRYMETIGDIEGLTVISDNLPPADEMDPESCYLGFEIQLKTEANKEEIEEIFEFVQEECVIHILPPHSHIEKYIKLINELPEENLKMGELLRLSGALTERELNEALQEQSEGEEPPLIGDVVVQQGVVENKVVAAAVEKQKKVKASKARESQLIRVNADKLEELIDLIGELVISNAHTSLLVQKFNDSKLQESAAETSQQIEEIRDAALSLRMVQIGETFNKFRRVVRELSKDLGKEIDLVIEGGETELDKTVVDKINDPLMHLIRNSLDHGIELPADRVAKGKPAQGSIKLTAEHDSGSIIIKITDDGNGLNKERILSKALEKNLIPVDHNLTDSEINYLIFAPGFSTADTVSNVSGRGVGMDVVKTNIESLRGQVEVTSTPGKGSVFTIRLPLTLAIIDGFLVGVGQQSYVVPLDMVEECISSQDINDSLYKDSNTIELRGQVVPIIKLSDVYNLASNESYSDNAKRENIVIAKYGSQLVGLVVDELLGEYQTVIKPLGQIFQNLKGLSGATILGSGEVGLIIDVPALANLVSGQQRSNFTSQNKIEQQEQSLH
ncbi:MAG: chemotaxis protein CheA [Methylococcaceae bacterium]